MVVQWAHTSFVAIPAQWWIENVVNTAEESTKAALREYLSLFARVINGVASWLVATFIDRDFYRNRQLERKRSRAWRDFWAQNKKTSTLNAVIEREGFITRRSPTPSPRGASPRTVNYNHLQQNNSGWGWWPFTSLDPPSPGPASPSQEPGMKRSGSDLFNRPSGFAVSERMERRGLGATIRMSLELAIEAVFGAFRSTVTAVLFLRAAPKGAAPPQYTDGRHESNFGSTSAAGIGGGEGDSLTDNFDSLWEHEQDQDRPRRRVPPSGGGLRRTRSFGSWEDMGVWTASDIILQAGYPLEEHVVTTSDGYILTMQRIPRKDSTEAVFFQHGILDTSLGWVSNGTEGSQAFAAYDRGADVFLGNCRANPPRAHADASRSGAAYWCYSINELGMEDVAAQVQRIHAVKTAELGRGGGNGGFMGSVVGGDGGRDGEKWMSFAVRPSPRSGVATPRLGLHKRSGSDSALAAAHTLEIATERIAEQDGDVAPPNEQQIKAHILAMAQRSRDSSADPGSGGKKVKGEAVTSGSGGSPPPQQQQQQQRGRKGFLGAMLARSPSSPVASPLNAEGGSSMKPRRGSFSRMFSGGSSGSEQQESAKSGDSPLPKAATSKRLSAAQRLRSYNVLSRAEVEEEEEDLEDKIEDTGSDATCTVSTATAGPKGIPPLRLHSHLNREQIPHQQPRSSIRPRSYSPSRSRAPSPEKVPTPEDSMECTPRSAVLPTHPLTTPDRVSIGGKEQPRLMQWGRAPSLLGLSPGAGVGSGGPELYRLQAVGHSLGGAALLIYAVMCRVLGRPHHLSRLVLLTPAGFHRNYPKVAAPFLYVLPLVMRLLNYLRPGVVSSIYV